MTEIKQDTQQLARIRCWLLDMDGTVTLGEEALPGAAAFFAALGRRDYIFLTNNSSHSKAHYLQRLNRIGIPADPHRVLTSTDALSLYLKNKAGRTIRVFPVGTPGFEADLEMAGIQLVRQRAEAIDYVALGFDTTLVYEKLDIACDYIRRGTPYLATNPDKVCPLAGGRVLPDCGALIAYMETCTGTRPERVMGKPETTMIDMVMADRHYGKSDLAMVGDRIYTDMAAARNAGILSIAVLSGEATQADIAAASIKPDFIFPDIGKLAAHLSPDNVREED